MELIKKFRNRRNKSNFHNAVTSIKHLLKRFSQQQLQSNNKRHDLPILNRNEKCQTFITPTTWQKVLKFSENAGNILWFCNAKPQIGV